MTDYTSQGKTRLYNVVDINNSRSHQSYYTALSRSASAGGTVILQGFDAKKITGGASGALRQEFRELELLDNITLLHYNRKLHATVIGECRNDLITAFRKIKGEHYVPHAVYKAIRWSGSDVFQLSSDLNVTSWRIENQSNASTKRPRLPSATISAYVSAKGTKSESSIYTKKHKISSNQKLLTPKRKKTEHQKNSQHHCPMLSQPRGTQWHNNSCAFDAVISILYNINWASLQRALNRLFNQTLHTPLKKSVIFLDVAFKG
jgi:hypothetical protein